MIIIFLYLVKEGLSFLQLFLELPETIWGLRKVLYTKKSPKITEPITNLCSWLHFAAIYEIRSDIRVMLSQCTHFHANI